MHAIEHDVNFGYTPRLADRLSLPDPQIGPDVPLFWQHASDGPNWRAPSG